MSDEPILVIKDSESTIGIRVRVGEKFSEHEIQLNVMLAYYWDNNLPVIKNLVDLFESVVKRTVNEVIPHNNLLLKYKLITDDVIECATRFEIHLIEVKADDMSLRLDGKILALKNLTSKEDYSKRIIGGYDENQGIDATNVDVSDDLTLSVSSNFVKLIEKNIPTKEKISFKDFAKQQKLKK